MLQDSKYEGMESNRKEKELLMKQLFLEKGKTLLQDVSVPLVGEGEILVKVHYSFISTGTELTTLSNSGKSILKKAASNLSENINKVFAAVKDNGITGATSLVRSKLKQLLPLGYSCSGRVIVIGRNVTRFKPGDFVACAGSGIANHAEIVVVPKNLAVKVRNESSLKYASLTTIGAIAMQGIRRADLKLGETVCVFGMGLIGQITAQLAKLNGAKVFGVDLYQDKLDLAQKLGTEKIFNANSQDLVKDINFASSHYGVDTTIVTATSASGEVLQQAMEITRRKGKVVLVGDVKIDFDREPFYSKEIDLLISCSYGPGRYDDSYEKGGKDYPYPYVRWTENRNMQFFMDLVQDKKIQVEPLISIEYEFENVNKAYESLRNENALGVVLSYQADSDFSKDVNLLIDKVYNDLKLDLILDHNVKKYEPTQNNLRTGFVGVGGFAKVKLLPLFSKIKNVDINSIVDQNLTASINIARQYQAKRFTSNYSQLVNDEEIDLAVIATPHKFHAQQSLDLLKSGKAVFVEKPAAVNFAQLEKLKDFFAVNKHSFYCVDFNRSFAPFNLAIKKELEKRTSPLMINYRMNAGFISRDHWIQSDENGGRIIGEACHIFELFCFLTDAKPIKIVASSLNPNRRDLLSTDNFSAQITMDDGSCCNLIYSSLGNPKMGKERMEIFYDQKSIVMQDYINLRGYGFPEFFDQKVKFADKGHKNLITQFISAAKELDGKSPIPFERIAVSTEISLIVDKLVREGGCCETLSKPNCII
ncbi:MAG: bi-domain-containing oxidoreductase [bacterium]